MSGSTRKLVRQKGTGGARKGDINSPLLRGGARVFGPQPRSYRFKLNNKVKDLARRSALTYKMLSSNIIVVEDFNFETPKTKDMLALCESLKVANKKVLFVLPDENQNVYLSARNVKKLHVLPAYQLNTYRIVDAQMVVMTERSVEALSFLFNDLSSDGNE